MPGSSLVEIITKYVMGIPQGLWPALQVSAQWDLEDSPEQRPLRPGT